MQMLNIPALKNFFTVQYLQYLCCNGLAASFKNTQRYIQYCIYVFHWPIKSAVQISWTVPPLQSNKYFLVSHDRNPLLGKAKQLLLSLVNKRHRSASCYLCVKGVPESGLPTAWVLVTALRWNWINGWWSTSTFIFTTTPNQPTLFQRLPATVQHKPTLPQDKSTLPKYEPTLQQHHLILPQHHLL